MNESWLRRALRWVGVGRPEDTLPGAQPSPEDSDIHERVTKLNSAQLCRAWRISFLAVISAKTATELDELAQKRRLYLEEMEFRNPAGFAFWLASSPAASSDPEPYLLHQNAGRRPFGSF
ncbi:hypothetical protein GCM10027404_06570 [Arthrobacter tumbae]